MALEISGITKRFGAREAVSDVSFTADAGEFVVLLGPSGCGKTTLLRMVAGLEMPDAGTITLAGSKITHRDARGRDVWMAFPSYRLQPHMSIPAKLGYPPRASPP